MWFHSLLASWKSGRSRGRRPQPRPARQGIRLTVEHLENRSLLSAYTAASASDLIADITAANAAGGANTITLTAETTSPYVLTTVNNVSPDGVVVSGLNGGANGLPIIAANDNLTILGNGDTIERSTASGTPLFRLLAVYRNASLNLANLTLENGVSSSTVYGGHGGAIDNAGASTLSGVSVLNNQADAIDGGEALAFGGAIYSTIGSLTLENGTLFEGNEVYADGEACGAAVCVAEGTANIANTTFRGNTAKGWGTTYAYGGALYVGAGQVVLTNTTLTNNNALDEFAGGEGGGMYVYGGTVSLSNCTVASNSAGYGAGLFIGAGFTLDSPYLNPGPPNVTISNCTVESNSASYGGGLYIYAGTVTLTTCTVESNSASMYGGGILNGPAGSFSVPVSGTVYLDPVTVANTINNTDSSGTNGSTANIDGPYILT